jgi:hypothetical protein
MYIYIDIDLHLYIYKLPYEYILNAFKYMNRLLQPIRIFLDKDKVFVIYYLLSLMSFCCHLLSIVIHIFLLSFIIHCH